MDDLGFIVAGYALVLGTILVYAALTIWRRRSMAAELPDDFELPPLPYSASPKAPSPKVRSPKVRNL